MTARAKRVAPNWTVKTVEERVLYEVKLPSGEWLRLVASSYNNAIDRARECWARWSAES